MSNKDYKFTELKDAMGTVNVIAVVKYKRDPVKTRGSGYSLFTTLTDPSLSGAKLPCIFFNDSTEGLPQIQAFGDVIVMHRLIVKEYRGGRHGYGYGTVGFAAVVFDGTPDAPLDPRTSSTPCSIGDNELRRVQQLRDWYHSPSCPVEKENLRTNNATFDESLPSVGLQEQQQQRTQQFKPYSSTVARSLWDLKPEQFTTVVGQVVAMYKYPNPDRCLLLYLWDGAPQLSRDNSLPNFMGPPSEHLCRLLNHHASVDSRLAAVTGHGLSFVPDWTVPLFLYDEHAVSSVATSLQAGALVRVRNVHVLRCRAFDCTRPGCLRLLVHGGGHQFGRGLELLPDPDSSDYDASTMSALSEALQHGLQARPFHVSMAHPDLDTALTIMQLCHIPLLFHRDAAERLGVCTPSLQDLVQPAPVVPPRSWLHVPNPATPHRTSVIARVAARVSDVFPRTEDDLRNVLIVACEECLSATRLSSISQSDNTFCDCPQDSWISAQLPQPKPLTCPFAFIKLEDATGEIMVHSWGRSVIRLFTRGCSQPDAHWAALINELGDLRGNPEHHTTVTEALRRFSQLLHEPVDLCVRMTWLTHWDLGVPASVEQLDLQFELVDSVPLHWAGGMED